MSDLIERLRRYSYQQGTDDEQGKLIAELVGDMHQAADEIERLRERLEIAGAHPFPKDFDALDLAVERNKALMAEIEQLRVEQAQYEEEIERLKAVVDAVKFHKNMMPSSVLRRLSALEDE